MVSVVVDGGGGGAGVRAGGTGADRNVVEGLPGPSNVVPFWVWYVLWIWTTKKALHWRVWVGF